MIALLITLGSHGDIHPFIAIGSALRARGHRAILATNPYFQQQIESPDSGGIEFAPLTRREDLKDLIARYKVMDPLRGPMAVMRKLVLPQVPALVARTRELIRELRPDVVVYHPIAIGARWACDLEGGIKSVSVVPSPLMWANPNDQMVLIPGRTHAPRRSGVQFDLTIGRWMLRLLMDPGLNRARRDLGLPTRRDNFHLDCVAGDLNLGIWSPAFRAPLAADPPNSRITGFCWHDRDHTQQAPERELLSFLDAEPDPPTVFALGSTGVHAAGRFYQHAARSCRQIGCRGLLVIGRDQPPPTNLNDGIRAFAYAPFSLIFPRAAAIVHHGGAGTTAQALRAGRPTLITPMAHDQFDNAARVKRLGAGETLRFSRVDPAQLESHLRSVLGNAAFARSATAFAERLAAEDGAANAADSIAALVAGKKLPHAHTDSVCGQSSSSA